MITIALLLTTIFLYVICSHLLGRQITQREVLFAQHTHYSPKALKIEKTFKIISLAALSFIMLGSLFFVLWDIFFTLPY